MTTYMFPGQGSQIKGMEAALFSKYLTEVEQANEILGYSINEVRWSESITYLKAKGESEFIEIGSGNVLTRLMAQN